MVLSADPEHDPSILGIVGAGAALAISDIPFHHLVSAVRVGLIDGKYIANPTYTETRAFEAQHRRGGQRAGHRHGGSRRHAGVRRRSAGRSRPRSRIHAQKIIEVLKKLVAAGGKTKKAFTATELDKEL